MGTTLESRARIEIRTGSTSDQPKIIDANKILETLGVPYVQRVASAHRTPEHMAETARNLEQEGFFVSIAGAGGSAHLAGMTASETVIPVVALPVMTKEFEGIDSFLSMVQMPPGVPNGTVGPGCAAQAAVYAAKIVAMADPAVRARMAAVEGRDFYHDTPREKFVGIVTGASGDAPYTDVTRQLQKLGIVHASTDYDVLATPTFERNVRESIREFDVMGAQAVIVVYDKDTTHLPGKFARGTDMPVIAVAVQGDVHSSRTVDTLLLGAYALRDSSLRNTFVSVGVNRYTNAALYAAQIVGNTYSDVREAFRAHKQELKDSVLGTKAV